MARLPTSGGDTGNWGEILNDYLSQAHDATGKLKNTGILASKYTKPTGGIPASDLEQGAKDTLATVSDHTTELAQHTTDIAAVTTRIDGSLNPDGTLKSASVTRAQLGADVAGAVPGKAGQVVIGSPTGPRQITTANPAELLARRIDDFSDLASYTVSGGGTATTDTTDTIHPGGVSITTASGASTTITRDLSVNLKNRFLSFWIKRTDENFSSLVVGLSVNGRSYTQRFETTVLRKDGTVLNRWRRVTVPNPAYTAAGAPLPAGADFGDARALRFVVAPAATTVTNVVIADMCLHDDPIAPGVIWNFDDGRADTYSVAFPLLRDRGFKGSIAVETGNVGTAGRCTLTQLQEMHAAGWEMNSHTVTGLGLSTTDMVSVRTQLRDSYAWLMANGFAQGAKHFVYPGGIWNEDILKETLRLYKTSRIAGSQNFETAGVGEYGLLKPYYFVKAPGVTLTAAKASLDRIADRGGFAYLCFHTITDTPSATEDWSIADFTALADYAASLGLGKRVRAAVATTRGAGGCMAPWCGSTWAAARRENWLPRSMPSSRRCIRR